MSGPKQYNGQDVSRLDESFKEALGRVRPYILGLTSADSAHLCKLWLDKLSVASSQRRLRNVYLVELCRQLKTGHIGGIFSRPPPNGLLLPLPKSYHMVCISSSVSDLSDHPARPHRSCLKTSTRDNELGRRRSKTLQGCHNVDSACMSQCLHAINISPNVRFRDKNITGKDRMQEYELRIDKLGTIVAELQAQNEYLKSQILGYQECRINNADKHLHASINQLISEIIFLKTKLLEDHETKTDLETNYKRMIEQYHGRVVKQIAELQYQLQETQLRNETLDKNVAMMAEKLQEIIHGKDKEAKAMEKQWMEKLKVVCQRYDMLAGEKGKELQMNQEFLERKNLELLQNDAERKHEIELLTRKIEKFESKLETKFKHEGELQEGELPATPIDQYPSVKEEFTKMKTEIDLVMQNQNQAVSSQIAALKKAVVTLKKSRDKFEHDYEKRISNIVKKKDMEIKSLQFRLQDQKKELSTSLSSEKQCEVDNIVASLEERYKLCLAEAQAVAENRNQEYLKRIAELEDQILRSQSF